MDPFNTQLKSGLPSEDMRSWYISVHLSQVVFTKTATFPTGVNEVKTNADSKGLNDER
jgi:hypothetical protein